MFDEYMRSEQARIEDEVVELLEKGQPITEEWVRENRKVYEELYKKLFSGRDTPYSPGKKDLEAINAALPFPMLQLLPRHLEAKPMGSSASSQLYFTPGFQKVNLFLNKFNIFYKY